MKEMAHDDIVTTAVMSAFTIRSEIGGKTLGGFGYGRFKLAHCIERGGGR